MISRPSTAERRELLRARASSCKSPIVFYGDSLIHYWEKEGKEAWDKYLAPLDITPFGIEGDCTSDLKERFRDGELDLAQAPASVMLLIGTNNTTTNWGKEPIEHTLTGIRELAEIILEKFPFTHLYIQKIFPRGRAIKNAVRNKGERINCDLDLWNMPRMTVLSHGELLLDENSRINPELTTDYIHLSQKGYELWASELYKIFSA